MTKSLNTSGNTWQICVCMTLNVGPLDAPLHSAAPLQMLLSCNVTVLITFPDLYILSLAAVIPLDDE